MQDTELEEIIYNDTLETVDEKIVAQLAQQLAEGQVSWERFQKILNIRKSKKWFSKYGRHYHALECAFALLNAVSDYKFEFETPEDAMKGYVESDYKIDFYYRKFYEYLRHSGNQDLMNTLPEKVEETYLHSYLEIQCGAYQKLLKAKSQWRFDKVPMQRRFFQGVVKPATHGQKVVVIVSGALRYECGVQLASEWGERNKVRLGYMVSSLPSFRALGLANLLPYYNISFDGESDRILVDGLSALDIANHEKILNLNTSKFAKTFLAEDYLNLSLEQKQQLTHDYDVLYLYSNRIDETGKQKTGDVFQVLTEEMESLKRLSAEAFTAGVGKILITSDHGFLYQNSPVEPDNYIDPTFKGTTFSVQDRFVIGSKLLGNPSAALHYAYDLNIQSELQVMIAKGLKHFKVQGAATRYVFGGMSLQETMVPLLEVTP